MKYEIKRLVLAIGLFLVKISMKAVSNRPSVQKIINEAFKRSNIVGLDLYCFIKPIKKGKLKDHLMILVRADTKEEVLSIRIGRNYENLPHDKIVGEINYIGSKSRKALSDQAYKTAHMLDINKRRLDKTESIARQNVKIQSEFEKYKKDVEAKLNRKANSIKSDVKKLKKQL